MHTKFWAGLSVIALMGAALAAIQSNPALAVGTSWTALPAAAANNWTSVAHGNGVWVAVSANGTVMRSVDDGSNWTAVSAAETNQWRSVAYGNGVWVAVANNGANRVMRSTDDGVSWTGFAAAEANEWRSVAYGNGVWVAVAANGTNRVMRSTDDGVNWATATAAGAGVLYSVAYGNGAWIAVGSNQLMRSADAGQNWNSLTPTEANLWWSAAYADGVWIAVAGNGTNRVARSLDPAAAPVVVLEPNRGIPGIFLWIAGPVGRSTSAAPVYFGAVGIKPSGTYILSMQPMIDSPTSRSLLATGKVNGDGNLDKRLELDALEAGTYKIVMQGTHRSGSLLVLTNYISVDTRGNFVSISPERLQPSLN